MPTPRPGTIWFDRDGRRSHATYVLLSREYSAWHGTVWCVARFSGRLFSSGRGWLGAVVTKLSSEEIDELEYIGDVPADHLQTPDAVEICESP
jgi:hypothetical protein